MKLTICLLLLQFALLTGLCAQEKNGFDLSNATVPVREILSGGPPRDGIPAINDPKFVPVEKANYLKNDDMVFGIFIDGKQRGYPLRVLVWHEIVNDQFGDRPIAITYCPLCGTAMAFERRYGDKTLTFGVSGLLYQSDVLMYDRETESLWSQLAMKSVSGSSVKTKLKWIPGDLMNWKAWREKYPDSEILSTETGFRRNYGEMPYQGYEKTPKTIFPVPETRTELGNKEWVAGLIVNGKAAALSLKVLGQLENHSTVIDVNGLPIEVHYDPNTRLVTAAQKGAESIPVVQVFWFAWQAFYPETKLWK